MTKPSQKALDEVREMASTDFPKSKAYVSVRKIASRLDELYAEIEHFKSAAETASELLDERRAKQLAAQDERDEARRLLRLLTDAYVATDGGTALEDTLDQAEAFLAKTGGDDADTQA